MSRRPAVSPDQFATFGELLKYLRRRVGLTQRALSIAVGYSDTQLSRQEHNQRIPDSATIAALYLPALELDNEPDWADRLLELASTGQMGAKHSTDAVRSAQIPHNLPFYLTSFIGREEDVAELIKLFSKSSDDPRKPRHRLVTITGPGGFGKTRLAIQAAQELLAHFPDGVWRVDLAPIADPELVPQTLARVLSVREQGNLPILIRLIEELRDKHSLLLLDNCEHLIQACSRLADNLLQACPELAVLATSRETLGIMGENTYRIAGLPVPVPEPDTPFEAIVHQVSIHLFVDRTRIVMPGFQVTPENIFTLVRICRQLEGMPLAIELAAARVKILNLEQIADRLEDAFHLLRSSSRVAHPHQQTLLATIDWSYNLLSEQEKILFRRLSVFHGRWVLEDMEAIAEGGAELPGEEILNLLDSLVSKSLIIAEQSESTVTSYRLLDTIRQYAVQKLLESGEFEVVQGRYCDYMIRLVERAEPDLFLGSYLAGWEDRLELEHDNLRAALELLISHDRIEESMRIAVDLFDFWFDRNYFQEGHKWYAAGLQHRIRLPDELLAQVLQCVGRLSARQGNYEQAESYGRESVLILDGLGDKNKLANALLGLSATLFDRGEIESARELDLNILELYQVADHKPGIAMALAYIGWDEVFLGEGGKGILRLEESLEMQNEIGNNFGTAFSTMALGICLYSQGNMERAEVLLCKALVQFDDLQNRVFICNCLDCLAGVAAVRHQVERAAVLFGISDRLVAISGVARTSVWEVKIRTDILSMIHLYLADDAFESAYSRGREMANGDPSVVLAYALEMCS